MLPTLPEPAVEGFVDVEVVVDRRGRVQIPRIRKGLGEPVDSAAVEAVRAWEFQPARSGRDAVAVLIVVRFDFAAMQAAGAPASVTAHLRQLVAEPLTSTLPPVNDKADADGIEQPRVIRSVRPSYTGDAMRARVEGNVVMELTILADGTVGSTRIVKPLDDKHGLDRQALIAARYWLFEPARRDGTPIPVSATLDLSFRIR